MRVIDLSELHRNVGDKYWVPYLAYLASTPRNSIEAHLEPPAPDPNSRIRVIEHIGLDKPEEAYTYPTKGFTGWWFITCLDGAPQRMGHQIKKRGLSVADASRLLEPAENRFRSLVREQTRHMSEKPAIYVDGSWHDGEIYAYESPAAAKQLFFLVGDACAQLNATIVRPGDWEWEYHVRAGIGSTVRRAFTGLLRSHRDQMCVVTEEDETLYDLRHGLEPIGVRLLPYSRVEAILQNA